MLQNIFPAKFSKIRRPLGGHQAEKPSESILCKRSFKVKSTVQEKLKLMAWSFLRGLSFEVLLERGKIVCFLDCYPSLKVPRGPPKRLFYPPHPPALPVREPPQTEVFRYFF